MYIFYKLAQNMSLGLYAVFGGLAVFKKKPLPLFALFFTHLGEYFLKVRPLAEERGIEQRKALIMCLLYGVTWWMPVEMGEQEI